MTADGTAAAARGGTGGQGPAWRPVARRRTFEAVLDEVERRIAAGELRAGDRLPGERQLSALLGVSRPSVREALRVLEARGVLAAQAGSGPEAGAMLVTELGPALARLVGTHLDLAGFGVTDVVEARWAIERLAVERAAASAEPRALRELREVVDAMALPDLDRSTFHDLDTAFHLGLVALSGNALLVAFTEAIRDAAHRHAAAAVDSMPDVPAGMRALNADHVRILAAVEAGDAAAGVEALDTHLSRAYPGVQRPGARRPG